MGNATNSLPQNKAKIFIEALPLRERLIWRIGTQTGLRVSDILHQKKKNIIAGTWKTKEQKTGKAKKCKIDEKTVMLAKAYMALYPTPKKQKIFINMDTNKPYTRQAVYKNIKKTAKRFKLSRISPHSSRKTFAQNLLKEGYSLNYIQKQLNHKSAKTTKVYLKNKKSKKSKN